jgi:hypothetical protein
MKMLGCVLLLIGGSLSAQSKPFQLFAPRSTQKGVTKQALDAAKLPLNLRPAPVQQVTNCAIPLLSVPVPTGKNFVLRRVAPSPSVDPKIVARPPLTPCVEKQ